MSTQRCLAQIERIALATSDLESLCGFYRRLGGVVSPSTEREGELRACALDFCGIRVEVFERPDGSGDVANGGRSPRLLHLGFALGSADAVDEVSQALGAAGDRVLEPPHRNRVSGRYESVVLDPDGNRVKLSV